MFDSMCISSIFYSIFVIFRQVFDISLPPLCDFIYLFIYFMKVFFFLNKTKNYYFLMWHISCYCYSHFGRNE